MKKRGFSLFELLLAILILAILMGILLPAMAGAVNASNRMKCASNCRQIGAAFLMYLNDWAMYGPSPTCFPKANGCCFGGRTGVEGTAWEWPHLDDDYTSDGSYMGSSIPDPSDGLGNADGFPGNDERPLNSYVENSRLLFKCPTSFWWTVPFTNGCYWGAPGIGWQSAGSDYLINNGLASIFISNDGKGHKAWAQTLDTCGHYFQIPNKGKYIMVAESMARGGCYHAPFDKNATIYDFNVYSYHDKHRNMVNVCFADGHVSYVNIWTGINEKAVPNPSDEFTWFLEP